MSQKRPTKAVILAGGLGTRISEETHLKPKPMIEIGGRPILWHIMKIYSAYGINEFIICCGYKGYVIKEYFANYVLHMSDVTIDLQKNDIQVHDGYKDPWKITLVNTGDNSNTGGRLGRVRKYVENDDAFCFTYGDGVADVNIDKLIDFHQSHGLWATMTTVQPQSRFGAVEVKEGAITAFKEKPDGESLVNGGFFVLSPRCLDLITGDNTSWEVDCLPKLTADHQMGAYMHNGFWRPMDTLRDKVQLEDIWTTGKAPWKVWS